METVKFSNFDIDCRYGRAGEIYVNRVLTHKIETLEVKRDRKWYRTRNLFIELEGSKDNQNWYPAGIGKTEATHCSFVLYDVIFIVPTGRILRAEKHGKPIQCRIPPNYARGFVITPEQLLSLTASDAERNESNEFLDAIAIELENGDID